MPWGLMLNWRLAAALLLLTTLSASHWKAYVSGRQAATAHWQAEALNAERTARSREQALITAKHHAEEAYVAQQRINRRALAGAQSDLGRLRDTLAAPSPTTSAGAPACARVDAAPTPERQLLGQCAQALTELAGHADAHAATISGLQSYINVTRE